MLLWDSHPHKIYIASGDPLSHPANFRLPPQLPPHLRREVRVVYVQAHVHGRERVAESGVVNTSSRYQLDIALEANTIVRTCVHGT